MAADLVSWEAWHPWHWVKFLPGLSEKDEQDVPHMKVLTSNITPKTAQLTGNQWINQKKALTSVLNPLFQ